MQALHRLVMELVHQVPRHAQLDAARRLDEVRGVRAGSDLAGLDAKKHRDAVASRRAGTCA